MALHELMTSGALLVIAGLIVSDILWPDGSGRTEQAKQAKRKDKR